MRLTPLPFCFLLTKNHCNLQRNNISNFFIFIKIKTDSHSTVSYFPILLSTVFLQLPFLSPLLFTFSSPPPLPPSVFSQFLLSFFYYSCCLLFFFLFLIACLLPTRRRSLLLFPKNGEQSL